MTAPWCVVDWLSSGLARVFAVRRDKFAGVEYLVTASGKRRRFRSYEAAFRACAKANAGAA